MVTLHQQPQATFLKERKMEMVHTTTMDNTEDAQTTVTQADQGESPKLEGKTEGTSSPKQAVFIDIDSLDYFDEDDIVEEVVEKILEENT